MKSHKIYIPNMQGISLIEVIITLSIISLIATYSLIINMESYKSHLLNYEKKMIVYLLEKARNEAINNINHTSHGIHITDSMYISFQGNPQGKDMAANTYTLRNEKILINGLHTILFAPLTGLSIYYGTIILSDGKNNLSISINYEGKID